MSKNYFSKVIESRPINNSEVHLYLNPTNDINRMIKNNTLDKQVLVAHEALLQFLKERPGKKESTQLSKYLQKNKVSEYEKLQINNNTFSSEAELLLIVPSLDRLGSKELQEIIKMSV